MCRGKETASDKWRFTEIDDTIKNDSNWNRHQPLIGDNRHEEKIVCKQVIYILFYRYLNSSQNKQLSIDTMGLDIASWELAVDRPMANACRSATTAYSLLRFFFDFQKVRQYIPLPLGEYLLLSWN